MEWQPRAASDAHCGASKAFLMKTFGNFVTLGKRVVRGGIGGMTQKRRRLTLSGRHRFMRKPAGRGKLKLPTDQFLRKIRLSEDGLTGLVRV